MVDWAQFKINNYEKETTSFEEMIYLLFCSKYGHEDGIFSYVNQPGIETEPIEIDGECIGFQAKYYTDGLSNHTDELINTIEISKRRYPNLTKIEIYTNSQYGPGRGKGTNKPKSQIKVENIAKSNNIKIDWFVKSNLDEILVLEKNKIIHDKFFGKEKSSLDYIIELNSYSESMFDSIENKIVYHEQEEIKLERSIYLQNITNALSEKDLLIISGNAGCGKSALVKEFHETEKSPFLMFKADDFEAKSLHDFYNKFNLTLGEFRDFYNDSKEKFIFIDAAEKISTLKNQRTFEEFLKLMVQDDWKIILTSRNDYSDILRNNININYGLKVNEIKLQELTIEEMKGIFRNNGLTMPANSNLKNSLQNLFYLSLYVSHIENINQNNDDELKNILWELIIKKSYKQSDNHHEKREHCFLEFVKNRSINPHFKFKIDNNFCSTILNEFQRDGIIEMRYGRLFIIHDVYEDWALEKIINNELIESNGDYATFLNSISISLKFTNAFKNWLTGKLIDDYEENIGLVDYIITNDQCVKIWIDETILAILHSNTFESFLTKYKYIILKNDYVFERILYWLKTVFIIEDNSEFSKVIKDTSGNNVYKPYGKNWEQFISFLYDNIEKITEKEMKRTILSLLYWNKHYPKGATTRYSSLIALNFYEKKDQMSYSDYEKIKQNLLSIILLGANEIKKELEELLQKVISNNWKKRGDPYYDLSIRILSSTSGHICEVMPELILKLAKTFWICDEEPDYYRSSCAELFLIDENTTSNYHYASAFETPILLLLNGDSKSTIDFIIDFVNVTTENCAKNTFDNNRYSYYKPNVIELNIGDKKVIQYISNALWQCYRGTSSPIMPKLSQSIHMALECFLLTECDKGNFEEVEKIMKHILCNSKSASLTAVVNIITLAFPDRFFDIALILFKTIELFAYDTNRLLKETETETLYRLASSITERYMVNERLNTIDQKFRKINLESLLLRYQFFREEEIDDETFKQRLRSVQNVIDQHKNELNSKNLTKDEMNNHRILLSKNDRRNLSLKVEEKDNQILITFKNDNLDEDLKKICDNSSKALKDYFRYADLNLWANAKLKHEKIDENQIRYENDLELVLNKFKELINDLNNKDYFEPNNTPLLIATCLLTFYSEQLNNDEKEICKDVILANIYELLFDEEYCYQISYELNTGINAMPIMFDMFPEDPELFMVILLLILFNDGIAYGTYHFCDFAIISLRKLYNSHPNYVNTILCCYSIYKQKFNDIHIQILKENRNRQILNPFALAVEYFLEKYENELENLLKFNSIKIGNLDLISLNIIFQVIPNEITLDLHYEFIKDILPIFSKELFNIKSSLNDSKHFIAKNLFLSKLSLIILENKKYLNEFISPFVDSFSINDGAVELLDAFCINVNENTFNEFWDIWWMFLDKIKEMHATCGEYNLEQVFKKFIFNYQYKIDDKSTQDVNELEKQFYGIICKEFGQYDIVLDLISKLVINDKFILMGLNWLYVLLYENNFESIKKSTVTNLDIYINQYIIKNTEKIKMNVQIQNKLSIIINFLISNNSSNAYRFNKWLLSIK